MILHASENTATVRNQEGEIARASVGDSAFVLTRRNANETLHEGLFVGEPWGSAFCRRKGETLSGEKLAKLGIQTVWDLRRWQIYKEVLCALFLVGKRRREGSTKIFRRARIRTITNAAAATSTATVTISKDRFSCRFPVDRERISTAPKGELP
jgi:hypothetical protein